jgi:hypothetical protein
MRMLGQSERLSPSDDIASSQKAGGERTPLQYGKSAFVVCLSLSNLCFLSAWRQLESRYFDFFLRPPIKVDVAIRFLFALLADILLLAMVLWGIYLWISRSSSPKASRIVAIGFLCALAVPLNLIRTEAGLFSLGNPFALGALLAAGAAIIFWHMTLFRPAAILVMLCWPLLVIQLGSSVWHIIVAGTYSEPALVNRLPGPAQRRVVWMVFDEFDQHLSFDARPADVPLPNLDALKAQSLYATNARRSARDTLNAIPSLLLGKTVSDADVVAVDRLRLKLSDGSTEPYPDKLDIFSQLRKQNVNSAISGWYYPYCRIFNDSVPSCVWAPAESCLETIFITVDPPVIKGFFDTMVKLPRNALARFPGMELLGLRYSTLAYVPIPVRSVHEISEYQAIYDGALRFSVDPGLGLVFLHFPIPHHYGIYDAHSGRLEPRGNYFDNLQLVDKTVFGIRSAMEKTGVWDSTSVLVSTDHSLRYSTEGSSQSSSGKKSNFVPAGSESPLVPFLLKLADQRAGIRYATPFNALITRELILAILAGAVSSPEQVVQWLDSNGSRTPTGR